MVAAAVVGSAVVGGVMSSQAQKSAANSAADAQSEAGDAQIAESRRQFDAIQNLLRPYTQAGEGAVLGQRNLIGLGGAEAQQQAIQSILQGPQMQALQQQGENSILQNASATGGLRGGNTQAALAQFRPQLLNSLINQQFQNLGSLTSVGQNAAAGVGNAGMQSSQQIQNALGQQGAAQAGAALAGGQANADLWGGIGSMGSTLGTLKLMGKF